MQITKVELKSKNIVNEIVSFRIYLDQKIEDFGNPYDLDFIKVSGTFSINGKEYYRPGFFTCDYEVKYNPKFQNNQGYEWVEFGDEKYFEVNFLPKESGIWNYEIKLENNGNTLIYKDQITIIGDKSRSNIVDIDEVNNRTFTLNEKTFMPVGLNLAWYNSTFKKTEDYVRWFKIFKEHNLEIARVWMSNWAFSLHAGKKYNDFSTRLNQASRLDHVLRLAQNNDIKIYLTLLNHGQFSEIVNPNWHINPYNKKLGGILEKPEEFFTNELARKSFKDELYYIVGRYGCYESILAWELFNEVDWTDNYSAKNVSLWHDEMAKYIKSIDCYNHLVTTSFKMFEGDAYFLDSIDFINPHCYNFDYQNLLLAIPEKTDYLLNKYKKPVVMQEIGIDWRTGHGTYDLDNTGITIHQAAWAGIMGGATAGGMHWWWDSFFEGHNLWWRLDGAANFSKKIDLYHKPFTRIKESTSGLTLMGYLLEKEIYGYIFNDKWIHSESLPEKVLSAEFNIPFEDGNYELYLYETKEGKVVKKESLCSVNNMLNLKFQNIDLDLAFIIKKGE